MATDQRQGRFTDPSGGQGIVQGYRDAVKEDPFNKKFLARNYKEYDVLKKAGLGKPKNIKKKLKGRTDAELENIAAKAVLQKAGVKRKKLTRKYNTKKHNIKWAKKVMARRAAGQSVKKQTLKRTKAARRHVQWVNRNRKWMSKPKYPNVPKGF